MNLKNLSTSLVLVFCLACGSNESKSAKIEATNVVHAADSLATAAQDSVESEPADDEIREFGLLKEVEDSGYPMATLTIEFPERKFTEYFLINLEEVKTVNMGSLRKMVGKYVAFFYKSESTNALMDMQVKGKTIINDANIVPTAETQKVVGVLHGADEETQGDLPGRISITTKDNEVVEFDFFITAEMVKANGTRVVVFYAERNQNTISSIKFTK